jgi:hypothetical protein
MTLPSITPGLPVRLIRMRIDDADEIAAVLEFRLVRSVDAGPGPVAELAEEFPPVLVKDGLAIVNDRRVRSILRPPVRANSERHRIVVQAIFGAGGHIGIHVRFPDRQPFRVPSVLPDDSG